MNEYGSDTAAMIAPTLGNSTSMSPMPIETGRRWRVQVVREHEGRAAVPLDAADRRQVHGHQRVAHARGGRTVWGSNTRFMR
ncbi:hypothetical protein [Nonomuraea sediminis]|uniref:hypothetical protein n=1 Tax=Nonomuraea sediminis TaxID=2835864 RepID=UPI001BDC743F|nr:hypothetical protein [Nonomuraea sediminis]